MGQQTYTVVEQEQSFGQFIWNSRTNEFLGRNAKSWGLIFGFYCLFYTFLAGFMSLAMFCFMKTISYDTPSYNPGDGSSILRHPALGFRPLPPPERIESSLIWYDAKNEASYEHYVESINEYLEPYTNMTKVKEYNYWNNCTEETKLPEDTNCFFDVQKLGPCRPGSDYGYGAGEPCVILKLNKMFKWTPELYLTESDFKENDVPAHARTVMKESAGPDGFFKKMIWVTCEGENPADSEYMGDVKFYPNAGFPNYYYPYMNTKGYLQPVVAVQFTGIKRNVLVNVECKIWSQGISHVRKTKLGLAHFELLVDAKN